MAKGTKWTEADIAKLADRGMVPSMPVKAAAPAKPARKLKDTPEYGSGPLSVAQAIKPLSVNGAWKGKRFKTDEYKNYEAHLLRVLPDALPPAPPYRIYFEFGFSNSQSDWDNPCKPLQDIMQKKYGFNDRDIMEAHIVKKIVPKEEDYFIVTITSINPSTK